MIFHLMIVDDEPTIRKGLSSFIRWDALDCVVDCAASDGAEAITLIRKKQPDIVITDIRMPKADGIEVAKFISEEYPHIKVILLTGYADFQYAQSAIRYGVSDFLLKPTSRDKLTDSVKKAQAAIAELRNRAVINKEDFSYLQEQCLADATAVSKPDESLLERCAKYQIGLEGFYAVVFQISTAGGQVREQDCSALKSILSHQPEDCYVYSYGGRLIVWIYKVKNENLPLLKASCHELVCSMQSLYDIPLIAGISSPHQNLDQLSAAVMEAIGALSMNFYNDSLISVYEPGKEEEYFDAESVYTMELYHFENMMKEWAFEEALSLQTIAEHVHVNPSHLSRTFKKECGENITEYINKVRIEKAQELLSSSNTLTYEVAEQVGFNDPAYFSSIFKKYTGLNPKEFKQKNSI